MRRAIVFDLDNTILNTEPIFNDIYIKELRGDSMWDYFYTHCNEDNIKVVEGFKKFYEALLKVPSIAIIISTARNEKCREKTIEKLTKENIIFDHSYMRGKEDYRPSPSVKKEHIQDIMQNYEIVAFIDDDLDNCEMAQELGIYSIRKV